MQSSLKELNIVENLQQIRDTDFDRKFKEHQGAVDQEIENKVKEEMKEYFERID